MEPASLVSKAGHGMDTKQLLVDGGRALGNGLPTQPVQGTAIRLELISRVDCS